MAAELTQDTEELAYRIRRLALEMVHRADSSHIGGALSVADILAVLYGRVLRVRPEEPEWPERDRLVFSKGHACTALYAALALKGFFPLDELADYGTAGTRLLGHVSHHVPGVEWSTGSLGHGLGLACGQALAALRRGASWRVFAVLSDGELDEGSTWEAVLFAAHHRLGNLTAIVDRNRQQALGDTENILRLEDICAKLRAFGWQALEVDGHDHRALLSALEAAVSDSAPTCIVARTVKGCGVDYMENRLEWHYRAPKTRELLESALRELAQRYGRPYEPPSMGDGGGKG